MQIRKYRGASKEGHLGAIKNVVVQQKKDSAVKTKYCVATKDGIAVEINYLTAGAETIASR